MRILLMACLFCALCAGATGAQESTPPVFIYPYGDKGGADVIADALEGEIGKRLLERCVPWTDQATVQAVVDWERMGELLGKEPNQELLESVADAIGARYVISVVALTHPDGRTSLAVQVYDRTTGKTIAYDNEPPAEAEKALENTKPLADRIVKALSSLMPDRCDEYWAGTISQIYNRESESESSDSFSAGSWPGQAGGAVNTSTFKASDSTKDTIQASLRPPERSDDGQKRQTAQVTRKFESHLTRNTKSTAWIKCGAFGRGMPNPMRQADREQSHLVVERGAATSVEHVQVVMDRDSGRYTIQLRYPSVAKKRQEERRDTNPGNRCVPDPISSSSQGEEPPREATNIIKLGGQVDPNSPDLLAGREVSGDLKAGRTERVWNLRRVKPSGAR